MNPSAVDPNLKAAGQAPQDHQFVGDSPPMLESTVVSDSGTGKPGVATASASKARQQPPQDAAPHKRDVLPKRKAAEEDDPLDVSAKRSRGPKRVRIAETSGSDGMEDQQEGNGTEDEQESNGEREEQESDGGAAGKSPEAERRVTRSAAGKKASGEQKKGGQQKSGGGARKSAAKKGGRAKAKVKMEGAEDERQGSKTARKQPPRGRR